MDYSIFKPGDKVRGAHKYQDIRGTVLFTRPDILVIERESSLRSEPYVTFEFEKIPERTNRFSNVYLGNVSGTPRVSDTSWSSDVRAVGDRNPNCRYIGMFEQVFEDGKLVDTIYHPD